MPKKAKQNTLITAIVLSIITIILILTQKQGLMKAYVTRVVDGDTIKVEANGKTYTVRLIGVNTPETNHPTKGVEPYGPEAKEFTTKQLTEKTVWLELDVEEKDKYNRLLAYVWLEKPVNFSEEEIRKKMFNAILLLEGYAQVMTVPPNVKYADYFVKFQREAFEKQKGLWGLSMYNENTKSDFVVYISKDGKKYHLKSCRYVNSKYFPVSIEEARQKGYTSCGICKPDEAYEEWKSK